MNKICLFHISPCQLYLTNMPNVSQEEKLQNWIFFLFFKNSKYTNLKETNQTEANAVLTSRGLCKTLKSVGSVGSAGMAQIADGCQNVQTLVFTRVSPAAGILTRHLTASADSSLKL